MKLRPALISALAAAVLAGSAAAAPPPRPAAPPVPAELLGKPNWAGVWTRIGAPTDPESPSSTFIGGSIPSESQWPPLTPEYREKYRVITQALARGERLNDPTANCLPAGFPWMMNMPYPMEIHQTPRQMTVIAEWMGQTRRIYIGDQAHPEELDPTYFGHSIAHWEGDTLVVDTVGLRADTNMNDSGLPHSDQTHVIERWSMTPEGILEDDLTVLDPKMLSKPWVRKFRYRRAPPAYRMMEYVCENNRDGVDMDRAASSLSKALSPAD